MTKHTGKTALSLSGGKDSTAVLLRLIELGRPPDAVVFFDGGWEFPAMDQHIMQLKALCIGNDIEWVTVQPQRAGILTTFDFPAMEYVKIKGLTKGSVGYGWPHSSRRWCTRVKVGALNRWYKDNDITTGLIGIAHDERHRIRDYRMLNWRVEYPLITWKWTEADCLTYCFQQGYDWDGLYDYFRRVSCWCCPLQGVNELRKLWKHFPRLWARLERMQDRITVVQGKHHRTASATGFKRNRKDYGWSVHEWTRRFEDEHKAADELRKR